MLPKGGMGYFELFKKTQNHWQNSLEDWNTRERWWFSQVTLKHFLSFEESLEKQWEYTNFMMDW